MSLPVSLWGPITFELPQIVLIVIFLKFIKLVYIQVFLVLWSTDVKDRLQGAVGNVQRYISVFVIDSKFLWLYLHLILFAVCRAIISLEGRFGQT